MKIINQTKNTIIAKDVIVADTLFQRIKGLLGRKKLEEGHAIILKPCNSIHTFFMHFSIDVIFVDQNSIAVKTIPSLRPFRLTSIYFNAAFAIELPANTLKSTFTAGGDIIALE